MTIGKRRTLTSTLVPIEPSVLIELEASANGKASPTPSNALTAAGDVTQRADIRQAEAQ